MENSSRNPEDEIKKHHYDGIVPVANRLSKRLLEQIETIIGENSISLGVPVEVRIKSYKSIIEKIKRKPQSQRKLSDIEDIVGIRIIVLFQPDSEELHRIITDTFDIIEFDDTSKRLDDNQFGYQSNHYIVKIPDEWAMVPSYRDLGSINAEIQVRTVAQHIWAAASHKLQYKREDSVPGSLKRSIHRISALLETVDLELSRLIQDRIVYVENIDQNSSEDQILNVETIKKALENTWPAENSLENERYDNLLIELNALSISTIGELEKILEKHKASVIEYENNYPKDIDQYNDDDYDRYQRNVFFTHLGLSRQALVYEFGQNKVMDVMINDDDE